MTLPLRDRQEVRADVDTAYSWYENQRAGLGDEFLTALSDILRGWAITVLSNEPSRINDIPPCQLAVKPKTHETARP